MPDLDRPEEASTQAAGDSGIHYDAYLVLRHQLRQEGLVGLGRDCGELTMNDDKVPILSCTHSFFSCMSRRHIGTSFKLTLLCQQKQLADSITCRSVKKEEVLDFSSQLQAAAIPKT